MTGKPKYDPNRESHNVAIEAEIYEGLKAYYPYAQLKALVNHILAEHLQLRHKLLASNKSE